MADLLELFDDFEKHEEPRSKDHIVRAPFGYPGGKSRSIHKIITHLPYRKAYVSVFGGSGIDILARHPSQVEVFNDRYAGIVAFYRCLRDKEKLQRLCEMVELSIHSREEFVTAKNRWIIVTDDVKRAFYWYTMTVYSFGSLGRNWGRSVSTRARIAGKLRNKVPYLIDIHERFKHVQVENQDWYDCLRDYDSPETVFYLDPPYVDANRGIYKHEMTHEQHAHMLDVVFDLKGFVAISGYPNPLYDNRPWDDKHTWEVYISMDSRAFTDGNKKKHLKDVAERGHTKEVLWIKEAH